MTKDYYRSRHDAPSSLLLVSRRRTQIDLIIVILQCIGNMHHLKEEKENRVNASPLNLICQSARMIHPQARRYLSLLHDAGLIRRHHPPSKPKRESEVYYLTKRGNKFLKLHKKMIGLMPENMVPSLALLMLES
jgi:predicted transcriptional regulator